jgi:hypothetical protein
MRAYLLEYKPSTISPTGLEYNVFMRIDYPFKRHPPLDVQHFEYYQGGECLSNAHWLGPWRLYLMTNYGLRQNHRKIVGKTKKSAFCVPYSVARTCEGKSLGTRLGEGPWLQNIRAKSLQGKKVKKVS